MPVLLGKIENLLSAGTRGLQPKVALKSVACLIKSELTVGGRKPRAGMAGGKSHKHMLVLSKSDAKAINNYRLGVQISQTMGQPIEDLLEIASEDRFKFARRHLNVALSSLTTAQPNYRNALARGYYSMYHAARAIVYLASKGDDHQEHSELPKHLPGDLSNRDQWENSLKNARLERNRADYDPYPKGDKSFKQSAEAVVGDAKLFLKVAKAYLIKKGCNL